MGAERLHKEKLSLTVPYRISFNIMFGVMGLLSLKSHSRE